MQFAAERNVVEFVRDFARDLIIIFIRDCSQEPIPDERGREVRVVVLELSHIISRNDARPPRVECSFRRMDLCGENLAEIDSYATASLRFLPLFRRASFLSLSLSFAERMMLRMRFRVSGFPFPFPFRFGSAFFFLFLVVFLSPGWFSPKPGGQSLHRPNSLFVRVDARGSFIGSNGGSSDGTRHHHQYEYREHAFVGYTEKTKKTKKKCTDMSQMCGSWAQAGECEKNREYMFENCCCGAS
jgi:hypothetical protein